MIVASKAGADHHPAWYHNLRAYPDEVTIEVGGRRLDFGSPADALVAGIGMVQQHFSLIPDFTVTQNLVLGHEPIRVETPEGKQEYVAAQRDFAERGAPLRLRLIDECERLLRASS